jgi:uncharacterized zinc-type alcohol dehydrogenase-like protein
VGTDDVKLDMSYNGLFRRDIHTARNKWHESMYPTVSRHEIIRLVGPISTTANNYKVVNCVSVRRTIISKSENEKKNTRDVKFLWRTQH